MDKDCRRRARRRVDGNVDRETEGQSKQQPSIRIARGRLRLGEIVDGGIHALYIFW
jgi:hypothetical protein